MMILVSQHARRRGRSFSLPLLLSLLHERWKRRTRKQALMRARSPPSCGVCVTSSPSSRRTSGRPVSAAVPA